MKKVLVVVMAFFCVMITGAQNENKTNVVKSQQKNIFEMPVHDYGK